MPAHAFDVPKAMRALTAAGMQEPMAEAVATKSDIETIDRRLETVNGRLDVLKTEISSVKWALGFIAAMALLMAGRMFGAF